MATLIHLSKIKNDPNEVKSIPNCASAHKDSKNVWFVICAMFRYIELLAKTLKGH